jgi:hypothetical protein
MRISVFVWALFGMCALGAPGCTVTQVPPPPTVEDAEALFALPPSTAELKGEKWLDHPWPSDLRKDADGSIQFDGFYNPYENTLLKSYISAAKGLLKGFSPAAPIYLRFSADLDPQSLPETPADALKPNSSLQLIDIDAQSPERGKRKLIQWHWRRDAGVYWLKDTLAVSPAFGYGLRPKTRYAVIVKTSARSEGRVPVKPSADLQEVLGLAVASARSASAKAFYADAVSEIVTAGIAKDEIAHMTVFTTGDPTAELFAIADDVRANVAAPTVLALAAEEQKGNYDVYQGMYGPSPNYQVGTPPYEEPSNGGGFQFENGRPKVQNVFDLRFALVVPKAERCPIPDEGYPIVLYAHGTGGDYRTLLSSGSGPASVLADRCVASMGIDQIFHGTRPGSSKVPGEVNFLFFNVDNIIALRTNPQQAAVDVVQQARLFSETKLTIPAESSRTGYEIRFDPKRIIFAGHSQGGLNGPLFLAADNQTRGGVLTGAGGLLGVPLLEKTKPEPSVAALVKLLLQLRTDEEAAELNMYHPVIAIAQTIGDASDPYNYGPYIVQTPRPGFTPKSMLQFVGVAPDGTGDTFAPPRGIELLGVAMGLPLMTPAVRPIPELAFGGYGDLTVPAEGVSGNLAGGKASGAIVQVVPPPGVDGHFAAYADKSALTMIGDFCRNLAKDEKGRVPAR